MNQAPAFLRFITGVRSAIRGMAAGLASREVRKTYLAAVATLVVVTWVMSGLGVWGVFYFLPIDEQMGTWAVTGRWVLRLVGSGLAFLIAAVLALPVAQVISPVFCAAPFFSGLSLRNLPLSLSLRSSPSLGAMAILGVTLRRLPNFVAASLAALLLNLLPGFGSLLSTLLQLGNSAWFVSSELLDPYFEAKGLDYAQRTALMKRFRPECLGFGLVAAPLLAIPFIGPFLFAWIQAAAADFVVEVFEKES